jgi:hypothetical protein
MPDFPLGPGTVGFRLAPLSLDPPSAQTIALLHNQPKRVNQSGDLNHIRQRYAENRQRSYPYGR